MPCHPDPHPAGLLVAGNGHVYLKLCRWLCCLPATQDQLPPYLPTTPADLSGNAMTVLPDHMDFITNLPHSDGYDSIMAVVDQGSSKGAIFMPCNKTIDATGTATLLLDSLYRRYGLPDKAISDRGPQFTSHVFQELGRLLGINLVMSTAHHPQTDGATE